MPGPSRVSLIGWSRRRDLILRSLCCAPHDATLLVESGIILVRRHYCTHSAFGAERILPVQGKKI